MKFTAYWSEFDQGWIGRCNWFPSLSWIEDTKEHALEGIRLLVWLEIKNDPTILWR